MAARTAGPCSTEGSRAPPPTSRRAAGSCSHSSAFSASRRRSPAFTMSDSNPPSWARSRTVLVNRVVAPGLTDALKPGGRGGGLHMTPPLGPPVAPPKRVGSLLDAEGKFTRDARDAAQRARPDEARIELGMQIDEFR